MGKERYSKAGPLFDVDSLFSVKDKVALVTGGSSGIGLMIAQAFVESGAKVYISSRKPEVCEDVAQQLSEAGRCVSLPADVATHEGRQSVVAGLKQAEKALHVLVNNAGTNWGAPLDAYPEDSFRKVTVLNTEAVFHLTRDLLPLLEAGATAEDPARVINVGSIDGIKVPIVDNFAYSASKAAVHHMTRVLAVKLGPRHVTVNAIAPGPFESRMTDWMLDNMRDMIEARCPLGRIGAPKDMAGIALFLASRAGAYLTGTVTAVDGGLSLV
jgi:NAD(P)-dependent dehydrogenase (short-subunit alcohol dehydrogenase family)